MASRLLNINSALKNQNKIKELRLSSKINKAELLKSLLPPKISEHFADVYNMIRQHAGAFQHADAEELSRTQQRELSARQTMIILKTLNIDLELNPFRFLACMYAISFFGIGQTIKGLVQYLLYIKTLLVFKSNEYHEECLKRANSFQDLGSFSLTEMHHGSFSRGIATQAIYSPQTKQFTISTQGEKGMKFWIGNTAQTANKTILWAQLIVDGINYGPHAFIVQLRHEKSHQVLQGITIGDCGPKNGLNAIDNGYILIHNVRVPLKALLGKLGSIDGQGQYKSIVKTNQQRFGLHMSPLSSGRAILSLTCLSQSSAALTIAIRYACQRRQFAASQVAQQSLIIQYPTTRYRLLLPLAANIVYYFAAVDINWLYIESSASLTDPNKRIVGQLHAVSAVLKAKASWLTAQIITECRQVLGGHGYSAFSGLGRYYHDNDVNSTWEGDNNMLLQQTSKYLLKAIKSREQGTILNLGFVYDGAQSIEPSEETLSNLSQLRTLLQGVFIHRFNMAAKELSKLREDLRKSEKESENVEALAWNQLQPFTCNEMAQSYGDLIVFQALYRVIEHYKGSEYNKTFLCRCLRLWSQSTLLKASVNGLSTRKVLQRLILEGVQSLYGDCIAVTDVLAPPSFVMGSPFGQQDGEGMKDYLNMLFAGRHTFGRVSWFEKLLRLERQA